MTGGHLQTLVTPILILLFGSVDVSGQPPVFGNIPPLGYIVTNEDIPVGGLLLSFTVSGNTAIVVSALGLPTQELVNISQTEGNNIIVNVTTAQILDRDGTDLPGTSPVDLHFQANAGGEASATLLYYGLAHGSAGYYIYLKVTLLDQTFTENHIQAH